MVILAYDGVQALDVVGPHEVFAAAGHPVAVVAPGARGGATVRSLSGLGLVAGGGLDRLRRSLDTLVVAGGDERGVRVAVADVELLDGVRQAAARARRTASVCSGAFVLAEAGLLDGRRATTHWDACQLMARRYPAVTVDPDPIFVRDGNVWTSAGVTAGMDLALAMVTEDHGREVALAIARRFVLYLQRPGGQSQFSAPLWSDPPEREPLRDLQSWAVEHLDGDLTVPRLAARAAMSERNFTRVFTRQVGLTPARWVESLRVEAARRRLEATSEGVEVVAAACGLGTAETLRRAFLRRLRTTPTEYRHRFHTEGARP